MHMVILCRGLGDAFYILLGAAVAGAMIHILPSACSALCSPCSRSGCRWAMP
jgi:hypothetical protein